MKYGQKTIAFSAQNFRYGETQKSIFQPSLNWESNLNFFQTPPKKDLYAVLNSRVGGGVGWFLHFFRRPRTELINAFSGKISFKFWWKQDLKLENWAEARKKRSFLSSKSKLFSEMLLYSFGLFMAFDGEEWTQQTKLLTARDPLLEETSRHSQITAGKVSLSKSFRTCRFVGGFCSFISSSFFIVRLFRLFSVTDRTRAIWPGFRPKKSLMTNFEHRFREIFLGLKNSTKRSLGQHLSS